MSLISPAIMTTVSGTVMHRTYKMETEYQRLPGGVKEGLAEVASQCSQEYYVRVCQAHKQEGILGREKPASLKAVSTARQRWAPCLEFKVSRKWYKMTLQGRGLVVTLIQRQEPSTWVRRHRLCSRLLPITIHLTWNHTEQRRHWLLSDTNYN